MATKKVTFRWTAGELNTINDAASYYLDKLGHTTEEKLCAVILKKLIERLAPKVAFPSRENKVSLKMEEAYALSLASERVDLAELGNYEGAVLIQTFNVIDRL